eukprot:scaffold132969_cov28-Tisochrysis_lutea.AAC.2
MACAHVHSRCAPTRGCNLKSSGPPPPTYELNAQRKNGTPWTNLGVACLHPGHAQTTTCVA